MKAIDYAVAVRPLPGYLHTSCGDYGLVKEHGDSLFMALLDALGHGPGAADVIVLARLFLEKCDGTDLIGAMTALHEHLRGTRGAVAGLARIEVRSGELRYVGVGNITAQVYGSQYARFVPGDGIVGFAMAEAKIITLTLSKGDLVVLHSDGIPDHLNLNNHPELLAGDAKTVAAQLIERFAKDTDDAGCVVTRYE